jgi:hypothetical protein
MRFKLTKSEKEAQKMMKELIDKPKSFKPNDFKPGKILMYIYRPKDDKNPYDRNPLVMVLGRSRKYTLAWSINWTPPKMRKKVLNYIMKKNKKNIKNGDDIEVDYDTIKKIVKGLGPVIRLYINNRISPKGVVVPYFQYNRVIELRAENFIGISSEEAWALAKKKKKEKKRKKKWFW